MGRRIIERFLQSNELSTIAYFKSEKTHTVVCYLDNRTVVLGYVLKIFEKYLESFKIFKRVHRSYIINLKFIVKIDKQAGYLKLKNDVAIPISNGFELPGEIAIGQKSTNFIDKVPSMNFKIIVDEKKTENTVLIGKAGLIRFKSSFSKLHNFDKNSRWLVGVNADETGNYKHLFLIKASKNSEAIGKKLIFINNIWSFDVKHAIGEMKLKVPQTCKIEVFKDTNAEGFKIILRSN